MGIKRHIKKNIIILAVLWTVGIAGCDVLHDDLDRCDLYLKFRYDYNMANENWFAQQVEEVKVFMFDTKGKYVQTFTEKGNALKRADYRMQIPYHLKGCTAIVWAGKTDKFYSLPVLAVGDPMDKMTLKYEPENNRSDSHLNALWHGALLQMFSKENLSDTETVSLVRNTNDITLSITRGNALVDISLFDIQLEGANSSYDSNNNLKDTNKKIIYHPCSEENNGKEALTAKLHTLRFVKGADTSFSITERSSGKSIDIGGKAVINLIDYLLMSKPDAMGEQEYLDRRYQWDINIRIGDKEDNGYIALCITINNWTYWFQPADI